MDTSFLEIDVLNKKDACRSISQFFEGKSTRHSLFLARAFNFDPDFIYSLDERKRKAYITKEIGIIYEKEKVNLLKEKEGLTLYFAPLSEIIFSSLSETFGVTFNRKFFAFLTLNYVCPRYLDDFSFEVNYRKDNAGKVITIIHELIHFYYFEKWKEVFPCFERRDFEAPSLIWLLSEIMVDAVFKNTALKELLTCETPAYSHFYEQTFNGRKMMDIFSDLFCNNSIEEGMKKALAFVNDNKSYFEKLI